MKKSFVQLLLVLILSSSSSESAFSAEHRASSRGQSAATVPGSDASVPWKAGKWIEVNYGRPLLRGRSNIFGSGADYGNQVKSGSDVWRAGADQTTRLKTDVALSFGSKRIEPGTYDILVDLKDGNWTLILSNQAILESYSPGNKTQLWGAYGYDSKFDVLRAPMTVAQSEDSIEQFTIDFVNVTASGGKLRFSWDKTIATVPFTVAK